MANSGRPRKCDPKVDDLRSNIRQEDYVTAKKTLNEFGIDVTDGDGRTALLNSVIENKPDFLKWLIENGANVNHKDRIGYTALHFAAQNLLDETANFLLENGAEPNLQDNHGNPPLWTAIFESRSNLSVVKTLLNYNANPYSHNNYGASPADLYKNIYGMGIDTIL